MVQVKGVKHREATIHQLGGKSGMENFIYDIATKVYFGKEQIKVLSSILPHYGKKALLVYGGGSIKTNGIYDHVCKLLHEAGMDYVELSGVEANPRIETVRKGVDLCEKHHVDVLLCVGGGSVIDCGKAIGASYASHVDAWDIIEDFTNITKTLPLIAVLTIAATGSEMDGIGVISDMDKKEKRPMKHPLLRPSVAILDPTYTFSVSKEQTAAGVVDILSHLMETYFSNEEGYMQERLCEGLMKTCIHCGYLAYNNPDDYEARANMMWCASWAINDFLKCGRSVTWSVHAIEHQLSAYYDITHGIGLAILTPNWMRYVLNDSTVKMFAQFARNVWDVKESDDETAAKKGISCMKTFYGMLNMPSTLRDVNIMETDNFEDMAKKALPYVVDTFYPLQKEDIIAIYERSY